MASTTSSPSASRAAAPGRRSASQPQLLPAPTRAELAVAFSQALDLAEGHQPGHAARICYIALSLGQALDLPVEEQRTVFYAALLHDAGASPATAELCRLTNLGEEAIFRTAAEKSPQQLGMDVAPTNATAIVEALRAHPQRGADVARSLGFDDAVQEAIATHHERGDGRGYPKALKAKAIPIAGRIVGAADLIEALIVGEGNALAARRNLLAALSEQVGKSLDPDLVHQGRQLARSDGFWLGLYHDELLRHLGAACPPERRQPSPADLETFASVFADLADAKGEHTGSHGRRTAELAVQLATGLGFSDERRELLRFAALVHDVGLLGVPARIIAKPDILSLTEMQAMRQHPTYSEMVIEALPGLEDVARWVGAHHERPDGKGYPEMEEDDTIPLEGRIIALADTYVALTSPRPYRRALSAEDAQQVLLGGAGTQLDTDFVQLFCSLFATPKSSRTAPRQRQKR
ncbi:MAG: HD domain-containing phosphohydrolase [Dehalococcoidia bacterium]